MARLVFRLPRRQGGDLWDWRVRHARATKCLYSVRGIKPWAHQYLAGYWKWAGHFRRRPYAVS
eukprot:13324030-Alexandrium_andersonii.AAC.1